MKPYLSRFQEMYRSVRFVRQQIGWQEFSKLAKDMSLPADIKSPNEKSTNEVILVLAPHPDDEAFGCGGALAYHAKNGDKIQVIFLHSGDGGNAEQIKDSALASKREVEAKSSMKLLNGQADFWQIHDGQIANTKLNQERLSRIIEELKPTKIYAPWPYDNHPDHMDASFLLAAALKNHKVGAEIWLYEIWSTVVPNYFLSIKSVLDQKIALMKSHASQLKDSQYYEGIMGLNEYRGLQSSSVGPAEAYCVLMSEQFVRTLYKTQ